jgi:hypothetical protein
MPNFVAGFCPAYAKGLKKIPEAGKTIFIFFENILEQLPHASLRRLELSSGARLLEKKKGVRAYYWHSHPASLSSELMARPLRIQYAGARYYLMSRGDQREPIFSDDKDRPLFSLRSDKLAARLAGRCTLIVLMSNPSRSAPSHAISKVIESLWR